MLEAKLWHNKTETKYVKVREKVKFFKTFDQYPRRFNFGNFFNSIIPPPFCWGNNRSSENAAQEEWVVSFCLGWGVSDKNLQESFDWGHG